MRNLIFLLILLIPVSSYAGASRVRTGATTSAISLGDVNNVGTGDFSVGTWVKTNEDAALDVFVSKIRTTTFATGYYISQTAGDSLTSFVGDGTNTRQCGPMGGSDYDGQWIFYVMTFAGSTDALNLYINLNKPTLFCAVIGGAIGSPNTTFRFKVGNSNGSEATNGNMAYSFFYAQVLTDWELAELMYKPASIARDRWGAWNLYYDGSTEPDLGQTSNTGSVAGFVSSSDGPPAMIGVGPL